MRLTGVSELESHHFLGLLAQTVDAKVHHIAALEVHRGRLAIDLDAHAHAGWCAGGDDVARLQRHELAHIADKLGHAKNHGLGVAGLKAHAVHWRKTRI